VVVLLLLRLLHPQHINHLLVDMFLQGERKPDQD
jgi:hypothetical protein